MQNDERTASLDSQVEYAVALARAEGYTVAEDDLFTERYTVVDSSYERPALVEIRRRIAAGRYKALVCYSTDRLARTPEELLAIVSDAKRCGCKTLFVKNPTPDTKEGKLLLFISAGRARPSGRPSRIAPRAGSARSGIGACGWAGDRSGSATPGTRRRGRDGPIPRPPRSSARSFTWSATRG
jgi:hypothetical protein